METNYPHSPSASANSNTDRNADWKRRRSPVLRGLLTVALLFALGVAGYSVYVAVHEPDPQETLIFGQDKVAAGSPAGLRIVVRNRISGRPIAGAEVVLGLHSNSRSVKLGAFRTDSTGSVPDGFMVPEIAPGEYQLIVETSSSLGRDRVVKRVAVQHPAKLYVTSDKPVYQPGQTIHLRSLALNGRTQTPYADETVTFEIKDAKGNKVFKENRKSSRFGIAAVDFVLASELNLGRYEIRAIAGATATERTVEVKRYVLPKFKVQITTEKPYYLPGQRVQGSVQASYFFGQPVHGASVKLNARTLHEKPVSITELEGRTDENGKYSFQFTLPDFLLGMPQKNEQAFLDLTAEMCDTGGHTETSTLSLSVARSELILTVIPEAGVVVPGVENVFYVLSTYPDGRPAVCRIFLDGTAYQSDAQGVSQIALGSSLFGGQLDFQAIDSTGRKARVTWQPEKNAAAPAFLMRTDKAAYQAGQTAKITVLSPERQNTVFLDVIKDNQTILTKSIPLEKYKASYALPLPADLTGTLKLNAYVITASGEDRGCSRTIFVNPASGLNLSTTTSKPVYRPGEIAKVDFLVTDAEGHPAPAALSIASVDESVFALAESRPGLLQQFLDAEGELLKPRYQIKSFECPGAFLTDTDQKQALAQAYFASLEKAASAVNIDDLVKAGYIPQRLVDHAREMRGTSDYESYRKDLRYAEVMRLLEGQSGQYTLREATGPVKVHAVEASRKTYFKNLTRYVSASAVGLLFLSPVFLIFYYARPGAGVDRRVLAQARSTRFIEVTGATYNLLSVLTLLPIVCYPLGFLILHHYDTKSPGWLLLSFESIVVLGTLALQWWRTLEVRSERVQDELGRVRTFIVAFLVQFLVSRSALALAASHREGEDFYFLLGLASIIAPLLVVGGLSSYVRRHFAAMELTERPAGVTLIEVLIIISIFAILSAMLLPSLARVKAKAQRITLLNDFKQLELANLTAAEDGLKPSGNAPGTPRVRRDFPETLLWRPELITDDAGRASLEIPLADSITTWRTSVEAISAAGRMGSAEVPLTVFQDFFVDLDLPVSMSLGDQVSVPLTCYNYLKEPQDIRLKVAKADWFESRMQTLAVHLQPNEVKSVSLPLKVLRVGTHPLSVAAEGPKAADAIEREIQVLPVGERMEHTRNDILKELSNENFSIPSEAIPDSQSLWVKFYPSRFSEIVEGLEGIFQAPYGCFEQTSSTTYPNVLVLDYMKRMGRLTPEIEIKARKFINAGYQRLLTFEVGGGGFEWFGRSPANICLTAYGILEFTDMARVHPVEQAVIERARKWLFSHQNSDGSWDEIHRGWTWAGRGSMTAFVAWALAESGDRSPELDKALTYLQRHSKELSNNYSLALAANAFLARNCSDEYGRRLAQMLKEAATISGAGAHWTSEGYSMTYSRGEGMNVETTALCAMALMKAGTSPQTVKQALTSLSQQKSACGTWGSTQSTILAMRALLAGSTASLGQEFESTVTLLVNGKTVETFRVNKENSDVVKQANLTSRVTTGENRIELRQLPAGELPFQIAGVYWLPGKPAGGQLPSAGKEALQIDVRHDRTSLPVSEELKSEVTVRNNTGQAINMAIVDLGIPPGFDLDATSFQRMQQEGQVAKFDVTGTQVILYLRGIPKDAPLQFNYSLRAKYPLRVQAPPSAVYEYYQPKNRAQSKPAILQAYAN